MASMAERTMIGSANTAGGMLLLLLVLVIVLLVLMVLVLALILALVLVLLLFMLPPFALVNGTALRLRPARAPPRRTSTPHGCAAKR